MRFEYKIATFPTSGITGGKIDAAALQSTLNHLGEEGWELGGIFPTSQIYGGSRAITAFFKRAAAP